MNCLKGLVASTMELVIPETYYLNVLSIFKQELLPICRLTNCGLRNTFWSDLTGVYFCGAEVLS
jgi:hypothetical protein